MSVIYWEPLRQLERFDKVINGLLARTAVNDAEAEGTRQPAAAYAADAEGYVLTVDLPGVRKENVDISVEGEVLTVRAQRKQGGDAPAEKERQTYLDEIHSGTLTRSFRLAKDADASSVRASMNDGVLEVRVPRVKKPEPRKIDITN